jgi:GTP-binding protein
LGNKHFATSTHRTPRFAQPGEPGQTVRLQLELKLLADVGIIGLPNAGKSSLISVISSAHPKIADYPFTTLTPNLGVVKPASGEAFTVADIPGLIEGAHQGAGLGIRFLRHIERTRLLLHLIDAAAIDPQDPLSAFRTVNRELAMYSAALVDKPQVVVLNKIDLPEAAAGVEAFRAAVAEMAVEKISAATGKGLRELLLLVARMLEKLDGQQP